VSAFIEIRTNLSYSIIALNVNVFNKEEIYLKLYLKVLSPIILTLLQFLQIFWIAASCSAACGEANRSVTLLQKLLLLTELYPATAAKIQLFLHQVRDRKTKFKEWDFFTINHSLLVSIVGTIITLLVILV
jgi:hypothetical protein